MELDLDWRRRQSALWPEVSYELRPLRVWAFQALVDFWEAGAQASGAPTATAPPGPADATERPAAPSLAATARLMDVAQRIFPDHVRGLEGLRLRRESASPSEPHDEPSPVAALGEETLLLPLAAEIMAGLIEISALGAGGEKN